MFNEHLVTYKGLMGISPSGAVILKVLYLTRWLWVEMVILDPGFWEGDSLGGLLLLQMILKT